MNKAGYRTLTNREVLTALLEGKEIQEALIREGEEAPKWDKLESFPLFSVDDLDKPFKRFIYTDDPCIYRIKPETKTVRVFNGVELPDCVTEFLEYGEPYFAALVLKVGLRKWKGTDVDTGLLEAGCIYKNSMDAEIHHKALTAYETIEKEVLE